MAQSTEITLFGESAFYLSLIDEILPIALRHEYKFINDDAFASMKNSKEFSPSILNLILAFELIDKAHLAATAALLRTKRWADSGPPLL